MWSKCLVSLFVFSTFVFAQEQPKQEQPKQTPVPQTRDEVLKTDIENAVKNLASDQYVESEEAYAELLKLGRQALPALIRALDHEKPSVRRAACDLLGELRDPSAVTGLVRTLNDLEEYGTSISSSSARALGSIGDPKAIPDLLKLLDSTRTKTDVELRYEIVKALGQLRAREAVEALKKLIIDREKTPFSQMIIGCAAIEALGKIRATEATTDVAKQLDDKTKEDVTGRSVEFYAARALERLTGISRGPLFEETDEKTKETLKKWGDWWKEEKKKTDLVENKPKIDATRETISKIIPILDQFKLDQGRLPDRLEDLVTKPTYYMNPEKWPKDGYLKEVPKDAWARPLVYRPLGTSGFPYDLLSAGLDGKEGGTGADEDLWDHDRKPKVEEPPKKDVEKPKDGKK